MVRITHSMASFKTRPGSKEVAAEAPVQKRNVLLPLGSSACTQGGRAARPTGCARGVRNVQIPERGHETQAYARVSNDGWPLLNVSTVVPANGFLIPEECG